MIENDFLDRLVRETLAATYVPEPPDHLTATLCAAVRRDRARITAAAAFFYFSLEERSMNGVYYTSFRRETRNVVLSPPLPAVLSKHEFITTFTLTTN